MAGPGGWCVVCTGAGQGREVGVEVELNLLFIITKYHDMIIFSYD